MFVQLFEILGEREEIFFMQIHGLVYASKQTNTKTLPSVCSILKKKKRHKKQLQASKDILIFLKNKGHLSDSSH